MVFLNPAVLIGLLAASIPILIHLLNLRKLKKIEFSTLTFLKELQKNKIRKVKLKQWLLLVLRVLIILFLVFAFARPTLEGVAIGGTTSAAKTTAVFILDDSFSMSVVDQNGSYFNQAKQTIKNLLKNFQEGDEVGLILQSDNSTEDINLTSNFSEFERQFETINVSYASGSIHNSFITAAEIIAASQNFNKEIYILSDFQSGRLVKDEVVSDLSPLLDKNTRIYAINYSGKNAFNLSIDKFKISTAIFEKEKPVRFQLTINNHSEQSVNNTVVSLFMNEERASQQSISLNPSEIKVIEIEAVVKATGFIKVSAELEDDDIEYDNRRFLNIYIPDRIPVLLSADQQSDLNFVNIALLTGNVSDNYKLDYKPANQLLSTRLDDYRVIFIIGESITSGFERIKDFVEQGGGVVIFPSSKINMNRFNNLLNNIGLPKAESHIGQPDRTDNSTLFQDTDFDHPLLKNIFETQENKRIESPDIYSYYRILAGASGRNIISLPDGSTFLSEIRKGKGKVLLFNSAPVLSWNSFPLKGLFPALMNKSILYLATQEQDGRDNFAGEPVNLNIRNARLPQLRIVLPDGREDYINLSGDERGDFLIYQNTKTAGSYEVYSGEQKLEEISVNTDPAESITKYYSDSDIKSYIEKINFDGTFIIIDKNEDPVNVILQARFGSELWKYFLLIAILLALIEMTIARNAKKELDGVT
ncbi:MAG: BatA domain-containing protein [Ignavibacterium sp.]|nr:BatA domain-containing protein [Ignavibacterium sp.]